MTRKLFCALMALALLFALGAACAGEAGENLLVNGDFSRADGDLPAGWHRDMWLTDAGISILTVEEDGYEGACASVINASANDARFAQTVAVEPDSIYRLSGMIRAEGCDEGGVGASLSIEDVFVYTDAQYDTHGGWKYVELYGRTGPNQRELTVFARVGGYGSLSQGRGWFDNLELVKLDEAPADAFIHDFYREQTRSNAASGGESESPRRYTESWLLFTCAYALAVMGFIRKRNRGALPLECPWLIDALIALMGIVPAAGLAWFGIGRIAVDTGDAAGWALIGAAVLFAVGTGAALAYLRRASGKDGAPEAPRMTAGFIAALVLALVVRAVIAARVRGYYVDINCFRAWSERMASVGPLKFYAPDYFCDYPPGYMLLLWPVGAVRGLLGMSTDSGAYLILLKSLPMLADIAAALLVWRVARRRLSERAAMALSLLVAFNPALIADSAAWGQIDGLLGLLLALCALRAADGRYFRSLAWFGAALLMKPQALLFAPLGLAAMVCGIVRADGEERRKRLIGLAGGAGLCLGMLYAAALLCCAGQGGGIGETLARPVTWLVNLYSGTVQGYRYVTVNALNLHWLLGMNWARMDEHTGVAIFAWAMFALAFAGCIWLMIRGSRKPRRIFLIGGLLIVLLCCFGPMIHERYIFPGVLLLALAYACERDKRILVSCVALTCTLFLNEILVLQGGMTELNEGHLQNGEAWLNGIVSVANLLNAGFLAWTAFELCVRNHPWPMRAPKREEIPMGEVTLAEAPGYKMGLKRVDALLMAALTLVYGAVAFTNLGTLSAPQTDWVSSATGEAVVFDLGEVKTWRMTYYGGICSSTFSVELSNDGENWTEPVWAQYHTPSVSGMMFRWLWFVPHDYTASGQNVIYQDTVPTDDGSAYITYAGGGENNPMQTSRYARIAADSPGLVLYEIGFLDADGNTLPIAGISQSGQDPETAASAARLIDEQRTVASRPSYLNSTYFDEIYHARTAFEHLHGMSAYEWTHPPLGKVTMMLGIEIFGMTPFGWRFMGALMGVLMVPLMYLMVKQLTKRTDLSFIAACLMALDSMHFTQTRIATIDSYAVFWIMLMYLFMFRYCQMSWNRESLGRTLVPLGLCGVTMGVAWATKWIGLYASAGLAILFFWTLFRRLREASAMRRAPGYRGGQTVRNTCVTLLFCLLFFVIIPLLIYYFSYYRLLKPEGVKTLGDMIDMRWVNRVIYQQKRIFNYHAGLGGDTHYFRSPWYQWPVIWWPMWYYSGTGYLPEGMISSISCMGNPAVWWFGLAAMIFVIARMCWRRRASVNDVIVVVAFCSQFLPWVIVPRSTFIYHYFASVPFIIIASALMLEWIREKSKTGFKITAGALLGAALILFVMFYPLESGLPCSREYAKYLRWFKWYNY